MKYFSLREKFHSVLTYFYHLIFERMQPEKMAIKTSIIFESDKIGSC